MKLTKYIPIAIFSLVFMASCSTNDEQSEKVITNKPISYGTGDTRLAGNIFEEGDTFSVLANYSLDGDTVPYITDQLVTLAENVWKSDKTYYWPMGGTLDFYAVYPSPAESNAKSANRIDFKMEGMVPTLRYHIEDLSEDLDLVVAKSSGIACPSDQLVPLHFKHALGQMRLQFKNECVYGIPLPVRITSMTISALTYDDGIFDWKTMTMNADGKIPPTKSFSHIASEYNIPEGKTMAVGTYYMIPGVVKDFTVEITWQIINGGEVAATYNVKKTFSTEYVLSSGTVKDINFILRRAADGDVNSGDVVIEE